MTNRQSDESLDELLLRGLRSRPMRAWGEQVERLVGSKPSRALARAYVDLIVDPPFQSLATKPTWAVIFRELLRSATREIVAPLRPLLGRYGKHIGAKTMGAWMDAHVATLIAFMDAEEQERHARRTPTASLIQGIHGDRPVKAVCVQLWRLCRLPELADLATMLGPSAATQDVEPPSKGRETALEGWLMRHLAARADPLVARALTGLLLNPRFPLSDRKPIWFLLAAAILRHGDYRTLRVVESISGSVPQRWLRDELARRLDGALSLDQATRRRCTSLLFAGRTESRSRHVRRPGAIAGEAFLDAIYHDPHDDGARAAYAIWLTEQGDPRGEFISLQLDGARRPLTPAEASRESHLFRKHAREWLGPLAPLVQGPVRFGRGFPTVATVYVAHADALRAVEGHPAWSTLETIEFAHRPNECHLKMSAQDGIGHPVLRALRDVSGLDAKHLVDVCRNHPQVQSIGVFAPDVGDKGPSLQEVAEMLAQHTALRRLRFGIPHDLPSIYMRTAKILLDPARGQLEELSVPYDDRVRAWIRQAKSVPSLVKFELRSDQCGVWQHDGVTVSIVLERGTVKPRARAVCTPKNGSVLSWANICALSNSLRTLAEEQVEEVEISLPRAAENEAKLRKELGTKPIPKITVVEMKPPTSRKIVP